MVGVGLAQSVGSFDVNTHEAVLRPSLAVAVGVVLSISSQLMKLTSIDKA
jgi:hypothetical protein